MKKQESRRNSKENVASLKSKHMPVVLTREGLFVAQSVLSQSTIRSIISEPTGLLADGTFGTVFRESVPEL